MTRLWAWIKSWFAKPVDVAPAELPAHVPVVEPDTVCRLKPVLQSILRVS